MSSKTSVVSVVHRYLDDLDALAAVAVDRARTPDGAQGSVHHELFGKLCMEIARLAVYERVFLLGPLADAGAADLARAESDRLAALVDAAKRLEAGDPATDGFADEVAAASRAVAELADHQRTHLLAEVERVLDPRVAEDLGDRITPTMEPGATHSHPVSLKTYDGQGWPRPGYTEVAYEAFLAEVRNREPSLLPLHA